MKNKVSLSLVLISISILSYSQLNFSVSPGLNLNSASLGYSFGKLNPYAGIQVYSLSGKIKELRNNRLSTEIYRMNFFMPSLGAKYNLIESESLTGSVDLLACYVIARDAEIEDGIRTPKQDTDLFGVSAFAVESGFVAEYFFAESFSIGGEFGYRFGMYLRQFENIATEYYESDALLLNSTYSSISFNFYF